MDRTETDYIFEAYKTRKINESMPAHVFNNLKLKKPELRVSAPSSKEVPNSDPKIHDTAKQDSKEGHLDKEENAEQMSKPNEMLIKQVKMLINNALRNVFATIETLDGVDSLPYSPEIHSLIVNLDEEVGRLLDEVEQKMPNR